jgi:hypothetical protein
MTSISDIRAKYPQYNDLSDQQVLEGFHRKFYSDMDFNDFASRIEGVAPARSLGQKIYDNVIGDPNDGVESYGEQIGSLIRGGTAGVARGLADVPALPANIAQLGARGVEWVTGMQEPSMVSRGLNALPDTRDMLASVPVIGPESQYQAPGRLGQFASTVGEFAGGAAGMSKLLPGGMGTGETMLRYGVAPGVASEAAGQLTEGTAVEPYARAAAGIGAGLLMSPKPGAFNNNTEAGKMANRLQDGGVRGVTVGQSRGSQPLMAAEGRLQATPDQLDDFTASIMRQLGSTKKLATPDALKGVQDDLVQQMDDAVRGISIIPNQSNAAAALKVSDDYAARVPALQLNPRLRGIADEIKAAAASGNPVSLSQLKTWRSDIGSLTTSADDATRTSAHQLRGLINDMTDQALTSAGRADDIGRLAAARESYQNFVGIRDAASRAGAEGGTLSPQSVNQSVIRSQGRERYATGQTTPMSEFTRAGAAVLRPAPTVAPGGIRSIAGAAPLAGASILGGGALQAGVDPLMAGLLAAGGALAPEVGRSFVRGNLMQQLMRNPAAVPAQAAPMLPGLFSF